MKKCIVVVEIARQKKNCDEIKESNDKYIEESKHEANKINTIQETIRKSIAQYHTELKFFDFLDFSR